MKIYFFAEMKRYEDYYILHNVVFPFVTFSQVESVREFSVKIPLGELDVVSDSNSDDVETKAVELEVKLFYTEEGEELDSRIYQQISDEINEGGICG
jgi:hypothetical protein